MTNVRHDTDERPWERTGTVRRDCEPHEGPLLDLLAHISLGCGVLSCCSLMTALVGLPLGVVVAWQAGRDLAQMRAGERDPKGRGYTRRARDSAHAAIILNLAGLVEAVILGVAFVYGAADVVLTTMGVLGGAGALWVFQALVAALLARREERDS